MRTVYLIKHSENDISSKRGIDWFLENIWMMTEGYDESKQHQDPSEVYDTVEMLKHFGAIEFVELNTVSDLRIIHPQLQDYPPDQPGYEPITTDD